MRNRLLLLICILILHIILSGCGKQPLTDNTSWVNVSFNEQDLNELQNQVDNGHRPGLLDPVQVFYEFLIYDLKINIEVELIDKSVLETKENESVIIRVTLVDKRKIEAELIKPMRKDFSGIWQVIRYRILD